MRGLPPPPPDVVQFTAVWDVNGTDCSNSWWVAAPGADEATPPQLRDLWVALTLLVQEVFMPLLGNDTSISLLTLRTFGDSPQLVSDVPAFTVGAGDGTTALNACAVITWHTTERRVGGHAHTWLPLSRSQMDLDKQHLSFLGFATTSSAGDEFVRRVNDIDSPAGGKCFLVTLHFSRNGVPLDNAEAAPIVSAVASVWVGTLHRRIRDRRRAPPAP